MKFFQKLRFAFQYDIEPEFIVYDFKGQRAVRFQSYEDAKKFSDEQIEYLPKVLVGISKPNNGLDKQ